MGGWRDRLKQLGDDLGQVDSRTDRIPEDIHDQLPLADIQKVTCLQQVASRDWTTTGLVAPNLLGKASGKMLADVVHEGAKLG